MKEYALIISISLLIICIVLAEVDNFMKSDKFKKRNKRICRNCKKEVLAPNFSVYSAFNPLCDKCHIGLIRNQE